MRSSPARSPVILAVLSAVAALCACGCSATGGALLVRQNGREMAHFTVPQLKDLPQVEITTPQSQGAQVQKGPTVRAVLEAAGATGVHTVRVDGRDPAQTLIAAELTDQVILNITKRNTLKLTGTNLALNRWVRDVTGLVVDP